MVIGLDAATWTLIRPWIAEGRLPNLAKLMKAGVSGPLESIRPPITPPAWTSFMTGKNPGKHGIFHFDQIAAWEKADIEAAETYLAFDGRIAREDWIGQAKVLAKRASAAKRGGGK